MVGKKVWGKHFIYMNQSASLNIVLNDQGERMHDENAINIANILVIIG